MKMSIEEMRAVIDKHSTIKHWAYIIHDKDVREDGSPKEPHIHLYLNFGKSGASFATVASWFKDGAERVNAVKGKKSDILKYLTHRNAPDKYQYDKSEVISNFDVDAEIESEEEQTQLKDRIDTLVFSFAREAITYAQALKGMQTVKMIIPKGDMRTLDYWTKAISQIERLWKHMCLISTKGKRDMKIIFIHGKSGSGKSTYAEMYADMLCKKMGYRDFARSSASNDSMQDYMGEDIFILDNFRDVDELTGTSQSLTDVLKMLDPHFASSSKSRYTNKTFTGKLMIITSTKDPLTWFEGTKEQRWQFFRRIDKLIDIDKDNVTVYQEENTESGIPFLCGFTHDGAYIARAKIKQQFPNPVPAYVKETGKVDVDYSDDMAADMEEYLNSIRASTAS